MKRPFLFVLIICMFTAVILSSGADGRSQAENADSLALLTQSRSAARDFLATLKGVLVSRLAAGGPVHAVAVCADTAQELLQQAEQRHRLRIRRVSFRWRNKLDAPDAYEQRQLSLLEEMSRNGSLSEHTEVYEIVESDSLRYFRYMRPIMVQSMCLACHGHRDRMDAGLITLLGERYPEDNAFGYSSGDLRGGVSISIVLP
ncbi:MAG: DUF3365 domain-containing protein [Ignavibacteria bacterium]|nr:DUF3365 domain-containing protein [Ignavibacteria bacterium]